MDELPEVTDFCRVVLLRHPELHPEHRETATGAGSAPLGRRGRSAVLRWLELLQKVSVDRIFASDQLQSAEAAAALAKARGLSVEPDPRLRDQDMGEWQGRRWEDLARERPDAVRQFFENYAEAAPPGGESLGRAVERMLGWWTELAPSVAGRTVVVVGPGSLLTGFAAAMLGMRLSRSMSLYLPHGALGILDVFANGARLTSWNPGALCLQPHAGVRAAREGGAAMRIDGSGFATRITSRHRVADPAHPAAGDRRRDRPAGLLWAVASRCRERPFSRHAPRTEKARRGCPRATVRTYRPR